MKLELKTENISAAYKELKFVGQAFIGGKFVDAKSGGTFVTENPATGTQITSIANCDKEDVDFAVDVARKAFESGSWSRIDPAERKAVLLKWADLIEQHSGELALLDSLEAGKPIADCVNTDLPETLVALRWHAEATDKIYDQVAPTSADYLGLVIREPIGVVAAVLPWNFPAMLVAWKAAPALATGNSVIIKPAEQTSLSALRMVGLAHEAGIPAGVINVVTGFGESVGEPLGRHMDVDVVSFTGSTEVGRYFLKYAAESNLKRVILECGGKSPQVVMADVQDMDMVAENVVAAAFFNMGENCSCGSRLIVHKDIKKALLEKLLAETRSWSLGDPLHPGTKIGAMIEKGHMNRVLAYIKSGKEEGAEVLLGGQQAHEKSGGYFVEPTIFDGVTNDMEIAREEIFGPVLSVLTFETLAEAIQLANDTQYGLAASVYTSNVVTAHKLTRSIKAGTVSVNCFSEGNIATPFGGFKLSGFGGRDKGIYAHDQYTELKTIWYNNR